MSVARSSRQKVNEETVYFNETLEKVDRIDLYRIFQPNEAEYKFSSSAHETFSRTDHMLGHKVSLN